MTNVSVLSNGQKPIAVVLQPDPKSVIYEDLACFGQVDPIEVQELSVSSDITLPPSGTASNKVGSSYKLSGRITDTGGAAISKVRVTAIFTTGGSTGMLTDKEGRYELHLPAGEYSMKIEGVPGFRKTIVQGLRIIDHPLSLDIALDVDHESPTLTYTEFVCDAGGVCKLVSRRGDGTTKPKIVILKPAIPN